MDDEAPAPKSPEKLPPAPAAEVPPPPPPTDVPAPPPGPEGIPAEPAPKAKKEPKRPKKKYVYELKLFERYELSEVVVHDPGLARYINLTAIVIPHTGGR